MFFRRWEGHKWINSMLDKEGTWFKVKEKFKFFASRIISCHVILRCNNKITSKLKILGLARKLTFKIIDCEGRVLAEVSY